MPLPPLGTELSQTFRRLMEDLERQHLAELSGHTVSESVSMQHAQCPDSCRIGPTPSNVIGSLIRSHAHYLISCHCFTRLQHNIQFINLVIWFSHVSLQFISMTPSKTLSVRAGLWHLLWLPLVVHPPELPPQ